MITSTEIFAFIAVKVSKLMSSKVLLINRKNSRNCYEVGYFLENSKFHE